MEKKGDGRDGAGTLNLRTGNGAARLAPVLGAAVTVLSLGCVNTGRPPALHCLFASAAPCLFSIWQVKLSPDVTLRNWKQCESSESHWICRAKLLF